MKNSKLSSGKAVRNTGIIFLIVVSLFYIWQNPGLIRGPITKEESQAYLKRLEEGQLPVEIKPELLESARRFMAADDGKPIYMLNLMRMHEQLRSLSAGPQFKGTPIESNLKYEAAAIPMLLKGGGQPLYMGAVHDSNVLTQQADLNHWGRVLIVRYPDRRAFMDLISNPDYALIAPYKMMALDVVLTPSVSETILPPLWLTLSVILFIVFLLLSLRESRQRLTRQEVSQ